ncbi:tRNA glutamyl-Q(34) synthetase GluQRS [Rhodobaculum claviforme]|uniref:tRNA glutamyl-Q(34) synthetase GluQRS n=1 Tax=Rhodobaculum claviforme TaxID=1549854 RepID=A0A934TJG6_9RHOB|nr:tRNA glutamyl-Q(34) synthetase GluQRS [Rhodobaculum claviforme]MBK5926947.1 tRNA glutamyl-Q(34) synthetase GluQRS [Rhodobaculum claviforme]
MPPEGITRFAPSPTGYLHLGHAFSALTAWGRPGTCLLRIEDIDRPRCRPEHEAAILEDLRWLGLCWPEPVWRQSDRLSHYTAALERLMALGMCYPCRCTRAEIRAALSAPQEGATTPPYPGTCRGRSMADATPGDAVRLDLRRALALAGPVAFTETGPLHPGRHTPDPGKMALDFGDVVLARRDIGTSYHIAVVVDDAAQRVTEVVRGVDLFDVTPLHRLLQRLLDLPEPVWHHHALIRDGAGRRLAKRDDARAIRRFRADGATPADVAAMVGLSLRG